MFQLVILKYFKFFNFKIILNNFDLTNLITLNFYNFAN